MLSPWASSLKCSSYFIGSAAALLKQKCFSSTVVAPTNIAVEEVGPHGTTDYRMYFKDKTTGTRISPWHNIPLFANKKEVKPGSIVNMVCEMPKGYVGVCGLVKCCRTDPKMEIAVKEKLNPIKQDIKKGQLRFIKHGKLLFNYGALPQTFEDPDTIDPQTGYAGDKDPIDVIDICKTPKKRGDVYPVKVLGVLALLDEGETDWKLLAINTTDPLAPFLNDVEKHMPGVVDTVREWYRVYKVAEGKGLNTYAFDGKALSQADAIRVIQDAHEAWVKLNAKTPETTKFALDPLVVPRG